MVVVFDGVCIFCNRWVGFLLKRDAGGVLRFATAQSAFGKAVLSELGEQPDDPSTIVLVDRDRRYLRSEAVLRILAALGGTWRIALIGLWIPRFARDAAYTGFARRRYRWFGRTATCAVPDSRWRDRFVA